MDLEFSTLYSICHGLPGIIIFSGCPSVRPVLVIALSQEPIDGFLPNSGHVCILQS